MTDSTQPESHPHPLHDAIIAALRTVHDPEIPINIHDLGLIYGLDIDGNNAVTIRMTLTAPNCPMAELIVQRAEQAVRGVDGVGEVKVELVWEPGWTPELMSEAAKLELEFTGRGAPEHLRPGASFTPLTFGKKPSRHRRP